MTQAFYARLDLFIRKVIRDPKGAFGKVTDWWYRIEYQQRGGLHCHMVIWCEPDTVPADAVTAEMPRFQHPDNAIWRQKVLKHMFHKCLPHYCLKNNKGKCRFDFGTFQVGDVEGLNETGVRFKFKRTEVEDLFIASYNLAAFLCWDGHLNVLPVTREGWERYLAKYVAKTAPNVRVRVVDRGEKFEAAAKHLQKNPSDVNSPAEVSSENTQVLNVYSMHNPFICPNFVFYVECQES